MQDDLKRLIHLVLERLKEIEEVSEENKQGLLEVLNAIEEARRKGRISIKRELQRVQGLVIAIAALVFFVFGVGEAKRTEIINKNIDQIVAILLAGLGGYQVMNSDRVSDGDDDDFQNYLRKK